MLPEAADDRRRFWIQQMQAASLFMTEAGRRAVDECHEPLVPIAEVADAAGVEMVLSSRPHVRGLPRLHHLRRSVAAALVSAAAEFGRAGYGLVVEDALRTPEMQTNLLQSDAVVDRIVAKVRWEVGHDEPSPQLVCTRIAALVAATPATSTHVSGSAVDVSVIDRATGAELGRGAPYLELSELTPMDTPFVPAEAQGARRFVTEVMARHGFVAYPFEFWHYSMGDVFERQVRGVEEPARYGPVRVDLGSGGVVPFAPVEVPWGGPGGLEDLVARRLGSSSASSSGG